MKRAQYYNNIEHDDDSHDHYVVRVRPDPFVQKQYKIFCLIRRDKNQINLTIIVYVYTACAPVQ